MLDDIGYFNLTMPTEFCGMTMVKWLIRHACLAEQHAYLVDKSRDDPGNGCGI